MNCELVSCVSNQCFPCSNSCSNNVSAGNAKSKVTKPEWSASLALWWNPKTSVPKGLQGLRLNYPSTCHVLLSMPLLLPPLTSHGCSTHSLRALKPIWLSWPCLCLMTFQLQFLLLIPLWIWILCLDSNYWKEYNQPNGIRRPWEILSRESCSGISLTWGFMKYDLWLTFRSKGPFPYSRAPCFSLDCFPNLPRETRLPAALRHPIAWV